MAYMMSDLAEGSSAVRQLQQNIAAAPYVEDLTKAASERKIQEDRLATQYAPQAAAAKAEEEQMRLQTARLQKLATETNLKADQQLQQWLQTPEGKTANDADVIKKAASLKMHMGLTEEGAKLYERAEKLDAQQLANDAKQLANNDESISKADVLLSAVSDDNAEDYFNRLPQETKNLITKQVGEDNWSRLTGGQKKEVVHRLFLNTKGQLAVQKMENQKQITQLVDETKQAVANIKAEAALAIKNSATESAEKIAQMKIDAKETELKTKHQNELDTLEKKHQAKLDEIKASTVSKVELEDLKSKHAKELEGLKASHKEQIEKMREAGKTARANKAEAGKTERASDKRDIKDATFYIKEHDKIVKAGEKEEQALKEDVRRNEMLLNKSKDATWFSPLEKSKEDKRTQAYNAAVNKLNDFRKNQIQKEIDTFENAPDFPKKEEILKKLRNSLAAVDTPTNKTEPLPDKTDKTAPAKTDVSNNKPEGTKTAPLAMPSSAKEAVDGKYYQTKQGVRKWDAKSQTFVE